MLVKIIKQWCTSYSHVLYSGVRLLIEMAPYAERKSSIYQNNKALFLSSPKHCPCLHSHGHKKAYRWGSNQHPESNISWMWRRNNVKQWHMDRKQLALSISANSCFQVLLLFECEWLIIKFFIIGIWFQKYVDFFC